MGIRLKTYPKQSWNASSDITQHEELEGRNNYEQHPIWAITGLEEALLEIKESITELENKQVPWPEFATTESIKLTHDTVNEKVTADAIISQLANNALSIKQDGLYVENFEQQVTILNNKIQQVKTNFSQQIESLTALMQQIAENANSAGSAIKVTQTNHQLSVGNVVFCDTNGKYKKALAEDTIKIEAIGFVTEVKDNNNFVLSLSGFYETNAYDSLSHGTVLYLSESTAGNTTHNPITYIKPLAVKVPNGIIINIQRGNIVETEINATNSFYNKSEIDNFVQGLMRAIEVNSGGNNKYYNKSEIDQFIEELTELIGGGTADIIPYTKHHIKEVVDEGVKKVAPMLSDIPDFEELIDAIANSEIYPGDIEINALDRRSVNQIANSISNVDIEILSEEQRQIPPYVSVQEENIHNGESNNEPGE